MRRPRKPSGLRVELEDGCRLLTLTRSACLPACAGAPCKFTPCQVTLDTVCHRTLPWKLVFLEFQSTVVNAYVEQLLDMTPSKSTARKASRMSSNSMREAPSLRNALRTCRLLIN
jgi:hypothetical protein